jgi:hypothetical protein
MRVRQLTIILTTLTVAAIQLDAGILDWLRGSRDDNAKAIEWMMTYWDQNVWHDSLPKEDALRLARACLQYDPNPKQRFVEMCAAHQDYGGFSVRFAFHSYDPDKGIFTDPKDAGDLGSLMALHNDVRNANFLERILQQQPINGSPLRPSSKQSGSGSVTSPTSPPTRPLKAGDDTTLLKPVTIQYVPYGNPTHSPITKTLQRGTHVQFISRNGDMVRFHINYGINADYDIPADAIDLNP